MSKHNWFKCKLGTACARCQAITARSVLQATGDFHLVSLERAATYAQPTQMCDSPASIYAFLASRFANLEYEVFICLALDSRNRVRMLTEVSRGILTASLVHPREFFRNALIVGAAACIAVHNHPSGDSTPSRDDDGVTGRLAKVGHDLGISLLDHVILGNAGYYSYRERTSVIQRAENGPKDPDLVMV